MTEMTLIADSEAEEELIYNTTTVSKLLGVHVKTLRSYCTLMENLNYEFQKNIQGHRLFYKKDIELIKKIIDLKSSTPLTLNEAVKTVLQTNTDTKSTAPETEVQSHHHADFDKLMDEFSAFRNEQMEFNKKLIEQLMKQENYIKTSIDERDKKLLFAMKESMETRRQLAAAAEMEREEERNKKAWWQFWK
ncbi:MerR family transcriptional regulator [Lysinibacillus yapensis]|uniref:MerR family transcriptional regulator n=1 Tax=Ureibacillus yapensis TaxID=2304605 RepID=A0A396S9B6_9BACL|nr:MerR family transcriptional regulator [Lysinibacillus yapensis]RHW34997.1 MerR family transcriptional regulator [Lysinibacillus yapensis]